MLRILTAALVLLFVTGCSQKIPNTWQKRVVQAKAPQDLKLHVEEYGEGPPVLLLHGFGTSSVSFSRIIPPLSRKFHIYAIDLKGFGQSPKPCDHRYSVYDQALLVDRLLQEKHLDHLIVIGHSYGGGVALSLALLDPARISKMVLIDSASYAQQLPKLIRWLQIPIAGPLAFYLLPTAYEVRDAYRYAFYDDRKIPDDIVGKVTENLRMPHAKAVYLDASRQLVPEDIRCVSGYYRRIRIPTLIIWGAEDIVIRPEKAYRLHRDLPNSRLVLIPRCGHIPHEECPGKVLELLEKFMLK